MGRLRFCSCHHYALCISRLSPRPLHRYSPLLFTLARNMHFGMAVLVNCRNRLLSQQAPSPRHTIPRFTLVNQNRPLNIHIRGSIVVSISACHADDPGSIPGRGVGTLTPCACGAAAMICSVLTRPGLEPGISGSGGRRLIH